VPTLLVEGRKDIARRGAKERRVHGASTVKVAEICTVGWGEKCEWTESLASDEKPPEMLANLKPGSSSVNAKPGRYFPAVPNWCAMLTLLAPLRLAISSARTKLW